MNRPKTIFCDIDGTLLIHCSNICEQHKIKGDLLNHTLDNLKKWIRLNYQIILTTGRKESTRKKTEEQLSNLGIVYDKLIMGLNSGYRILINDRKKNSPYNTAYAVNVVRNKGLNTLDFTSKYVTIEDIEQKFNKKIWGSEEILEYNDKYICKKIFIKNKHSINLRYNELTTKTIYILNGKLEINIGNDLNHLKKKILLQNDFITIKSLNIYSINALENTYYHETSSCEIDDITELNP